MEEAVREQHGHKIHCNLSHIIKSLNDKDLIGFSNFIRIKNEIVFGGIGDVRSFRTDIDDIEEKIEEKEE